jgi:glutamine synthetase adenylyltransferase
MYVRVWLLTFQMAGITATTAGPDLRRPHYDGGLTLVRVAIPDILTDEQAALKQLFDAACDGTEVAAELLGPLEQAFTASPFFAVIASGKMGGIELGYGSDLDLVFLNDSTGSAQQTNGDKSAENNVFIPASPTVSSAS